MTDKTSIEKHVRSDSDVEVTIEPSYIHFQTKSEINEFTQNKDDAIALAKHFGLFDELHKQIELLEDQIIETGELP